MLKYLQVTWRVRFALKYSTFKVWNKQGRGIKTAKRDHCWSCVRGTWSTHILSYLGMLEGFPNNKGLRKAKGGRALPSRVYRAVLWGWIKLAEFISFTRRNEDKQANKHLRRKTEKSKKVHGINKLRTGETENKNKQNTADLVNQNQNQKKKNLTKINFSKKKKAINSFKPVRQGKSKPKTQAHRAGSSGHLGLKWGQGYKWQ